MQPLDTFASQYTEVAAAVRTWARLKARGPLGGLLDAEDLVQEVSYQAYRAFGSFDPQRGEFRGWVFGVANLVAQELLRKSARARANVGQLELLESRVGTVPAELTTISRRVARDEALERFLERVSALDDEERALLLHRGIEGLRHDEVGALLGITPESANKRWQRLRERLRDLPEIRGLMRGE